MPPRSDLVPFCFGKLPIAGDFIAGAAHAPEMAMLDAWVQDGLHRSQGLLGGEWQRRFDALPPSHFLWLPQAGGPILTGCWWASRDSAGRRYPFLIGVRITGVAADQLSLLPAALTPFVGAAEQLFASAWPGLDVVGAIDAVRTLPCQLDLPNAAAANATALQNAPAGAAWSGTGQHPELLLQHLEELAAGSAPPAYCLRWSTRGEAVDASFWLDVLASFEHSRSTAQTPRLLLWSRTRGDRPGIARLSLGRLEPRVFAGMVFADLENDNAYDLGRDHGDAGARAAAQQRFGPAVALANQSQVLFALRKERR